MFHYRKSRKEYRSYPRSHVCQFCDETAMVGIRERRRHTYVITNRTSYDLWELRNVTEHLLVIPRRHVHSLEELSEAELLEVMQIISRYEAQGYNIYARAPSNTARSIAHQHTHLIKTHHKPVRGTLFMAKPYFLFKF